MRVNYLFAIYIISALVLLGCADRRKDPNKVNDLFKELPSGWKYTSAVSNDSLAVYVNKNTQDKTFEENIVVATINDTDSNLTDLDLHITEMQKRSEAFRLKGKSAFEKAGTDGVIADYIMRRRSVNLGCTVLALKFSNGKRFFISHCGLNEPEGEYAAQRQQFSAMLKGSLDLQL
jgi:hypothetical protein